MWIEWCEIVPHRTNLLYTINNYNTVHVHVKTDEKRERHSNLKIIIQRYKRSTHTNYHTFSAFSFDIELCTGSRNTRPDIGKCTGSNNHYFKRKKNIFFHKIYPKVVVWSLANFWVDENSIENNRTVNRNEHSPLCPSSPYTKMKILTNTNESKWRKFFKHIFSYTCTFLCSFSNNLAQHL